MKVAVGSTYGMLPAPRKNNMIFNGWLVNGTNVGPDDLILDSVTVKATWIDDPTPSDNKIEWTGDIESTYDETEDAWSWDITNRGDYLSLYDPIQATTFSSNKAALDTYASAIVDDKMIYANDLMINCIYSMFSPKLEESSVFWCPNPFIDTYFASSEYTGSYQGWKTTELLGTSDFSLQLTNIYYDDEHNCIRVSDILNVLVKYRYTIKNPDSADTETFEGSSELILISKNVPFQFDYNHYVDEYYNIPGWATIVPNDFAHYADDGSIEGWGRDDTNWSLTFALNNCTIFDGDKTISLLPQELTPSFYYNYRNMLPDLTGQYDFMMVDLFFLALTPGWDDNGCYYLKNCDVNTQP